MLPANEQMSVFFIFTFGEQEKGDSEANQFRRPVQFIRELRHYGKVYQIHSEI
jgi:hypothetical protein